MYRDLGLFFRTPMIMFPVIVAYGHVSWYGRIYQFSCFLVWSHISMLMFPGMVAYINVHLSYTLGTSSTLPYGTGSDGLGAILFGTIFKMAEVNRATRGCSTVKLYTIT